MAMMMAGNSAAWKDEPMADQSVVEKAVSLVDMLASMLESQRAAEMVEYWVVPSVDLWAAKMVGT